MDCSLPGFPALLCPWNFPGKNAGDGCHFLLQRIFPTQGSNLRVLHWQMDSLPLSKAISKPVLYPEKSLWKYMIFFICQGFCQEVITSKTITTLQTALESQSRIYLKGGGVNRT